MYELEVASGETLNVPAALVVPPWLVSAGLNCVVETVMVEPSLLSRLAAVLDAASRTAAAAKLLGETILTKVSISVSFGFAEVMDGQEGNTRRYRR